MQYITTQEAAVKWNISDRRVRILCAEGRIQDVKRNGKTYLIPADAGKPADGRMRFNGLIDNKKAVRYLKWDNDIVGVIDKNNAVFFVASNYNKVVSLYTHGVTKWTPEQFVDFLSERVVSGDRRDIERILFRCGLLNYDVLRIAEITRGIHAKDLLWIACSKDETMSAVMTDVFASVFRRRIDLIGDSIDTPEGYNIKRYGVFEGSYSIYKQRINPLVTDVESEITVYLLAQKLGIPCCPAARADRNTVFSAFLYDYSEEYLVYFRHLIKGAKSDNEYRNLIAARPQYKDEIAKMILLDFITRQDDRHLSNVAIKINGNKESFYPLYDNGRSLFYEDTEEMVNNAVKDIAGSATRFGYSGNYWDYVQEIAKERNDIRTLIHLDITEDEISAILTQAGFIGYRFEGALKWITKSIGMVKALTSNF